MEVTRKSILTGQEHTLDIDVTEEQLAAWRAGANIQDACPQLDAPLREFIMTGIADSEWNEHVCDERCEEENEDGESGEADEVR